MSIFRNLLMSNGESPTPPTPSDRRNIKVGDILYDKTLYFDIPDNIKDSDYFTQTNTNYFVVSLNSNQTNPLDGGSNTYGQIYSRKMPSGNFIITLGGNNTNKANIYYYNNTDGSLTNITEYDLSTNSSINSMFNLPIEWIDTNNPIYPHIWLSRDDINRYQEVEYIESTGTQYIDTKFKPTGLTKIEMQYSNYSTSVDGVMFGGYDGNWTSNSFGLYANSTSSQWGYWLHYGSNTRVGNITTLASAKILIDKGTTYVNDTLMLSPTVLNYRCSNNMYIFNGNGYNGANQPSRYRLHYFKIWNNNILIRDFIPCYRKSDGVIGLYDKVSEAFFTNVGSGSFIKGNDI